MPVAPVGTVSSLDPAHTRTHAHDIKAIFLVAGKARLSLPLPQATRWPSSPFTSPPHHGAPSVCIYIDKSAWLIKVLLLQREGINKRIWTGADGKLGSWEPELNPQLQSRPEGPADT